MMAESHIRYSLGGDCLGARKGHLSRFGDISDWSCTAGLAD
jgi:hypothetical protein